MANGFCPMLIVVKGETKDSGFLPAGNYVEINGKKCPLGHCFNLEMPVGPCKTEVHSPPPNTIHRASTEVKEGQLYRLNLTVDASRNIIAAEFEVDESGEKDDEGGLYEILCRQSVENREEIAKWRAKQPTAAPEQAPGSAPAQPSETSARSGGKLVGWGLGLLLFFLAGVIGCCAGKIEMSNLTIYIVGAVIGLLMFLAGMGRRK